MEIGIKNMLFEVFTIFKYKNKIKERKKESDQSTTKSRVIIRNVCKKVKSISTKKVFLLSLNSIFTVRQINNNEKILIVAFMYLYSGKLFIKKKILVRRIVGKQLEVGSPAKLILSSLETRFNSSPIIKEYQRKLKNLIKILSGRKKIIRRFSDIILLMRVFTTNGIVKRNLLK